MRKKRSHFALSMPYLINGRFINFHVQFLFIKPVFKVTFMLSQAKIHLLKIAHHKKKEATNFGIFAQCAHIIQSRCCFVNAAINGNARLRSIE